MAGFTEWHKYHDPAEHHGYALYTALYAGLKLPTVSTGQEEEEEEKENVLLFFLFTFLHVKKRDG